MEALTAFGLATVTAMLVFYALEDRSPLVHPRVRGRLRARLDLWLPARRLAVGVVEAIWAGVAVWRWVQRTRT